MEQQKPIEQFSDLELAMIMQREYEQIIGSQGTLIVAEKEVQRRLAAAQQNAAQNIEPTPSTKEPDNGKV